MCQKLLKGVHWRSTPLVPSLSDMPSDMRNTEHICMPNKQQYPTSGWSPEPELCTIFCVRNLHSCTLLYTVRCRYNAVNFLQNPPKRHPIGHPLGRCMGCILWVQTLTYILSKSLQWWMQYHAISDRVITTLDCTWHGLYKIVFISLRLEGHLVGGNTPLVAAL